MCREETNPFPGDAAAMTEAWRLAGAHNLEPLAAAAILQHPEADWPAALWKDAQQVRNFALVRNLQLLTLLGEIQMALETAGIPWIALKGPVFTQEYAGDLALRTSSDLDVLVRPADVPRADRALRELNLSAPTPVRPDTRWLGVWPHEHGYESKSPRYLIELHWRVASGCYEILDIATAFRRARIARLETGSFPVLSWGDTLLFAAVHAFGDYWRWFSHVKNLDWILRARGAGAAGIAWDDLWGAAAQFRKTRILLLALALTRDLLHTDLPAGIGARIEADPAVARLQRLVCNNFGGCGPAQSRRQLVQFRWRAMETTRDRARILGVAVATRLFRRGKKTR